MKRVTPFIHRAVRAVCCAAMLAPLGGVAFAESSKPLQLVVGLPAGGTVDILTRQIAEALRTSLGRAVIVDDRPGAGGIIATEHVKNAAPDGTVLLVSPTTALSLYPLTMSKLPYKASDFTPVVHVARFEYAFGVNKSVPAKTAAEYAALVKKDGAYGLFGAPGLGGPPQFYGLLLARQLGISLTTVPYNGTPPLMRDLQGGQTPAAVLPVAEFGKLVKSGNARLLATTGTRRTKEFPDVPTLQELGVPVSESGQYAIYAPAGTPRALLDPIAKAVQDALQTAPVKSLFANMAMEPTGDSGAALEKMLATSEAFWKTAVRDNPVGSADKAGKP